MLLRQGTKLQQENSTIQEYPTSLVRKRADTQREILEKEKEMDPKRRRLQWDDDKLDLLVDAVVRSEIWDWKFGEVGEKWLEISTYLNDNFPELFYQMAKADTCADRWKKLVKEVQELTGSKSGIDFQSGRSEELTAMHQKVFDAIRKKSEVEQSRLAIREGSADVQTELINHELSALAGNTLGCLNFALLN